MRPDSGPHFSLVTQTWPPDELSVSPCDSQQIGFSYSAGGVSFFDRSTTPRNIPGCTMLSRQVGVQVPSLSATVTTSLGPTLMPLGARTPVAKTSSFDPSFETLRIVPLCALSVSHPRPPGRTGPALA